MPEISDSRFQIADFRFQICGFQTSCRFTRSLGLFGHAPDDSGSRALLQPASAGAHPCASRRNGFVPAHTEIVSQGFRDARSRFDSLFITTRAVQSALRRQGVLARGLETPALLGLVVATPGTVGAFQRFLLIVSATKFFKIMSDVLRRNNVTVKGNGSDVMMFAHGFIGDQLLWRHVAGEFGKTYRTVLFDYVGSGKSDHTAYDSKKYSTLEGYAQDVLDICAELKLSNVIFVSHSISGMIGLISAMKAPQHFSKMIMVAPSPRYLNDTGYHGGFERPEVDKMLEKLQRDYATWAAELAPQVMNAPDSPELTEELIQKLLSTDQRVALNFGKTTFFSDYRKELLRFKIPSLILQCAEDVMAPIEVGDYLNAHLENCTLQRLAAKGHFPQLSAPDEVVRAIKAYLKRR